MIRNVARADAVVMRQDGNGIPVRGAVPTRALREFNPFLLIEEVGPINRAAGEVRTVPPHPTRGFEQITWVLMGNVTHTRPGAAGAAPVNNNIAAGNAELVTAGTGHLQREEFPAGIDVRTLRIWISLPRTERNVAPRIVTAAPTIDVLQMWTPTLAYSADLRIELLAGRLLGARAPIQPRTRATVARLQLPADVTFIAAVDSTEPALPPPTVVLYGLNGQALVGAAANERLVRAGETALLTLPAGPSAQPNDDEVRIRTRPGETFDALWLCGAPVGDRRDEPLVQRGGFVMRTEEEILQAIEEYYTGRFGTLDP